MCERLSLKSKKSIFNKLKSSLVIVANHPFSWFETVVFATSLKQVGSDSGWWAIICSTRFQKPRLGFFQVDPFGNLSFSPANRKTFLEAVCFLRAGGSAGYFSIWRGFVSSLGVTVHDRFSVDTPCFSDFVDDKSDCPANAFSRSEKYPLPITWSDLSKITERVVDLRNFLTSKDSLLRFLLGKVFLTSGCRHLSLTKNWLKTFGSRPISLRIDGTSRGLPYSNCYTSFNQSEDQSLRHQLKVSWVWKLKACHRTAVSGNREFSCRIRKSYSGRWVDARNW